MSTDEEILKVWNGFSEPEKKKNAVISLYRTAEEAGRQAGLAALEKELLSDDTIQDTLKNFGWGRGSKAGFITQKAIFEEATRRAMEKARKPID